MSSKEGGKVKIDEMEDGFQRRDPDQCVLCCRCCKVCSKGAIGMKHCHTDFRSSDKQSIATKTSVAPKGVIMRPFPPSLLTTTNNVLVGVRLYFHPFLPLPAFCVCASSLLLLWLFRDILYHSLLPAHFNLLTQIFIPLYLRTSMRLQLPQFILSLLDQIIFGQITTDPLFQ
ncbi:hypothetical protein BLNAU_14370 [Blattamonas nauphoetae]|uniref:4Fe-4S ferredoxin-type domain-containing protein n=1 Tax=Blattamonas nauphoetae TaxID=2049346 RepID=A0ABQ9XH25_9EUKA|nr:hypothetical protein BLNAU_14370 [Blattamonas nauphoetae]